MSGGGLVLKLAPRERVLINSAVIENGDRRASLWIKTPNANILRLSDALHPDQATTPVTRAIYLCQLLLSGDLPPAQGRRELSRALKELAQVFTATESGRLIGQARSALLSGNDYGTLKALRGLIPIEARLLAPMQ
ncbi:flagellar biosynthesis repressor FlbT [Paracoccus sp. S-4012]|uniref:flagellar biosynthesis repressor FlbT n=1 Tax=Paracoccus sp. S-4012 TaxID=2665648 RepID=UPI0012B14665|nr:flagellar biosynthesis repressor FlbT [Paracoccus sp. S-4012]MRX49017.1 flagellar biosynthesis repressor FlbT [Paracoccus sp. S-4012]